MVIMSLVDLAQGKHRHVPYRDSRLTFLLQDSLGGNSKTTIIANVSPSICSANETLSTLKFAQRAKLIQNNAKINEDASAGVIALQQQIQQLKDQLSFLMKHPHNSVEPIGFAPRQESSLGYSSEGYEPTEETNMHDEHETDEGAIVKKKYIKANLDGALRRERFAETEIKRLKADIEHLNRLVHQQQEEAQSAKMILKFREEKIKRMELLLDGSISADKFYLDENSALREENQLLHEKIERNPEVFRLATENIRLLEKIRLFQDLYEHGEREALQAEISELRNQLLDSLEVEKSQAHHQFSPLKRDQDPEVTTELQKCKDMNSTLLREVNELQQQLSNRWDSSQDTFNSIDNVLLRRDSVDEAMSYSVLGDKVIEDENDEKVGNLSNVQCDNTDKQLMDAQCLIETMKLEHVQLIRELESLKTENQQLAKILERNLYPTVSTEGSDGTAILALQAKLEELSKDLKEAQMFNNQYIEDHATRLSQDHQTELVRSEVEMETTRTIIHLQDEIEKLQSEFRVSVCSMAEENLSLRNSVAANEDKLRVFCAEWEKATLELTAFLTDGSRSLRDASHQIKSISSSFPKVNEWINEHVEKAAKVCIEKEETILLLQSSLEDAQNTVMEMEQKLYSLKDATMALTASFQQPEKSWREEIQLSRMPNDLTEVEEFPEHEPMSKKGQIIVSQAETPILVENRVSDCSRSTTRGTFDGNMPLHALSTTDVDIQIELASLQAETENALNGFCSDAETYWSVLNSEIHDAVSLYEALVQDLLKDISDIRKDTEELKRNRGSLRSFRNRIPSQLPLAHENQQPILQQVRNELVEMNNRLSSMNACLCKVYMHFDLDSIEASTETDGCSTDSCSFDEESCRTAVLLLKKEFRKTYEAFDKLKNCLMVVSIGQASQNCLPNVLSFSDLHAMEKLNEQGDGHDQPTSKRPEACIQNCGEVSCHMQLTAKSIHSPPDSFFAKYEEADYMLKVMLKANENANNLTAMWKQTGEKLMSDNTILSEEIEQLKSCVLLSDEEKEALQVAVQFSSSDEVDVLSSLEECFRSMQTGAEELFETAQSDAIKVVEEMQTCFGSFRSSLEDLICKAMQNDISIFVLQCQVGEHSQKFRRLNTISNLDGFVLQEPSQVADNLEPCLVSRDRISVLQPVKCESKGCQISSLSREELNDHNVDKSSKLQRELEWKDVILKGVLFDFSLLQEFASRRKDIKDELEKLIDAMSQVQQELQIKNVQLDDTLVQKTKLEGLLFEAEQALSNTNSDLDQAKAALNISSEQNVELKDILKDLYLKNSEAEQLLEDQREAIKSLEKEVILLSSSQEKQSDYEDALTQVTVERNQLLEKLTSLQDALDMASALSDENQAIAAEARQESETSKMYAEQKEEEVMILERSVEELDSTINVLEKKVHEMEEEVEKQRLIRDSLELELQALRERLLTVEDLTECMSSDNSCSAVFEEQFSRKLHERSREITEARSRIRSLEEENAKQAKEIKQFKDYIYELVLHSEAQASQYQQKYKTLEAMLDKVKTDVSNVSAAPTSERADKVSAKARGSSSPFRCIAGLVQQMNQEKDQELSSAKSRIEELEALAAVRYKEVCALNTRLATAESMTHDVIRDLLSVKLDISNYANIIEQHQLQKLIEEAQRHRQDFAAMEHEIVNLRSQIDDLLDERERCYSELNRNKADQLAIQIALEQLQDRDQFLIAQNDMLKMDKSNLQKRVAELDDMVKKLFSMQDSHPRIQPQKTTSSRPFGLDLGERLANSQKVLSRVNDQLGQYRRPDGTFPNVKMGGDGGDETKSKGRHLPNPRYRSQNQL
ncbi:hypothetical protein ACS0TY_027650 [Phlomoides rotata]